MPAHVSVVCQLYVFCGVGIHPRLAGRQNALYVVVVPKQANADSGDR